MVDPEHREKIIRRALMLGFTAEYSEQTTPPKRKRFPDIQSPPRPWSFVLNGRRSATYISVYGAAHDFLVRAGHADLAEEYRVEEDHN